MGFLISGRMTKSRIDRMHSYYTEQGFHREFVRRLDLSSEQLESLQPILQKYAEQNRELLDTHRKHQAESFENLKTEIKPFLTPEQIKRMEVMQERWKRGGKKKGFRDGKRSDDRRKRKKERSRKKE